MKPKILINAYKSQHYLDNAYLSNMTLGHCIPCLVTSRTLVFFQEVKIFPPSPSPECFTLPPPQPNCLTNPTHLSSLSFNIISLRRTSPITLPAKLDPLSTCFISSIFSFGLENPQGQGPRIFCSPLYLQILHSSGKSYRTNR